MKPFERSDAYVEGSTLNDASAREVVALLAPLLAPSSVLDVGSAVGLWLVEWQKHGAQRVFGIDGSYVDADRLLIPRDCFRALELACPFQLDERFQLVQCLEVAEHLPPKAAASLVESLVRHGDVILFSAAVVGQGGPGHINEQPLDYWRAIFSKLGYQCFDAVRPLLAHRRDIKPWYRFNTLIYVRRGHPLAAQLRDHLVKDGQPLDEKGDFAWKLRRLVTQRIPKSWHSAIANVMTRAMLRKRGFVDRKAL